jgi:hypothetical protein
MLDAELSLPSRLVYVALLLAALTMTAIVGSLWATEPGLPTRTQVAFGVMTVIGLSWVAFAVWVLARRRLLYAWDSVVAGRMAVTFTATFVAGALVVGYVSGGAAPYAAAALGIVMLGGAVALLVRGQRKFARLSERRTILERELGAAPR